MITLLKNATCYTPKLVGQKDILIVGNKIAKIDSANTIKSNNLINNTLDCTGLVVFPALIDGHVHIIGGGGEDGFDSFNQELFETEIVNSGVTTLVGVLGADKDAKNLYHLLAKARSLELAGLNTYIFTGSYTVPVKTFTGDITSDLTLIDKVIGVGEIAISDERSSHPTVQELIRLASNCYMGGLLSGKSAVVNFHLGDGKTNLMLLNQILQQSDLPKQMFLPTHINRNESLFKQGVEYAKQGGFIDLTAGEKIGLSVKDSVKALIKQNVNMSNVTISSDANASTTCGMAKISSLYSDVLQCINAGISPEIVFSLVSKNVAGRLLKGTKTGQIKTDYLANIVVADQSFNILKVMSNGKFLKN